MPLRHVFAILAVLGGSFAASGASADPCEAGTETRLQVSIEGVRNSNGNVTITVYGDRPEDFLASGAKLMRHRVPAQAGVTQDCLALPGPGTYAIAAYHDEDGDRDWDRNFLGLPVEGYGLSNNPKIRFAPPGFDEVKFGAGPGGAQVSITMRY